MCYRFVTRIIVDDNGLVANILLYTTIVVYATDRMRDKGSSGAESLSTRRFLHFFELCNIEWTNQTSADARSMQTLHKRDILDTSEYASVSNDCRHMPHGNCTVASLSSPR